MAVPESPVANGTPAPAAQPQQAPAYAQAAAYQYPQYIPVPMPMPNYYAPQDAQPNIAPVSIDVSPMLEKALEATLAKFVSAFDKKIERFVDEHPIDIPVSSVGGASSPLMRRALLRPFSSVHSLWSIIPGGMGFISKSVI